MTWKELEDRLLEWIRASKTWKLPITTGATIRVKAGKVSDNIIADDAPAPSEALTRMTFSNGQLCKFQQRHNLSSKRVSGEATTSVADAAVKEGRAALKSITQGYKKRDIFNLDETAFFYCAHTTRSICARAIAGRKESKRRITIAIASNADGTMKLPLQFVGSSHRSRCFGRRTAKVLGLQYVSSKNAWMTRELFSSWV